ncbi:phosphatase PAP2 family protein [Sphingomonas sp. RT2P30]|uniref:acid phosphatase n=1 Tax=Parasphingomonas halimpatiens TaxID=3096162 RepID=UPI002FC7019E
MVRLISMARWREAKLAIAALVAVLAGVAVLAQQAAPMAQAPAHALAKGYLTLPTADSLVIAPPPPAPGSAAEARDVEASRAALTLRATPRWVLATADADVFGPRITGALSCAAQVDIGPATTPRLDALLHRTMTDLALSGSAIKRSYKRPRPFMVNGEATCTPDWEPLLRKDGSYPSGHSAIGYGWALILAQLLPDRAAALVARGRAFGDSRRVCNVHWLSDVEEGRVTAAMTVARLNADPAFLADLDTARAELRTVHALPHGCEAEAGALALVR